MRPMRALTQEPRRLRLWPAACAALRLQHLHDAVVVALHELDIAGKLERTGRLQGLVQLLERLLPLVLRDRLVAVDLLDLPLDLSRGLCKGLGLRIEPVED